MRHVIVVESPVRESPRVQQVRGLFDLAPEVVSRVEWAVELPLDARPWHVGLVTGPSGCGKTTIARRLWPDAVRRELAWDPGNAVVDDFPAGLSVKDVAELLSGVGFASPPAWLRPFPSISLIRGRYPYRPPGRLGGAARIGRFPAPGGP